jgi:hypothetical protein
MLPAGEQGILTVCHIETDSRVGIDASTCRETGRTVTDPAAHPILDQIVATAKCTPSVTSTPVVRPPDTGNAGLASR